MRPRFLEGARMIAPVGVAAFSSRSRSACWRVRRGWAWPRRSSCSRPPSPGSAQFAVASVLGNAGSTGAAIAAGVMLNARYAPIGISVAPAFHGPLLRRLLQSQLVVDETWAMTIRRRGGFDLQVLLGAGAVLYLCWNIGTAGGLVLGNVIDDPNDLGLDAAFAALFLTMLVPQLRGRREAIAALLGAGIALALIPFPRGWPAPSPCSLPQSSPRS
jgi:predicted branched-subunit amino acid permease